MQRLAKASADVAGRQYTMSLMRRAGMKTRPVGKIIALRAALVSHLPAIAIGSYINTLPNGAKYDGALGVMGAIEVVQALADQNHAPRPSLPDRWTKSGCHMVICCGEGI